MTTAHIPNRFDGRVAVVTGYVTGVNLFVDGGWEQTAYPDLRPALAEILTATADTTNDVPGS